MVIGWRRCAFLARYVGSVWVFFEFFGGINFQIGGGAVLGVAGHRYG